MSLFVYMVILFLIFIIQFSVSCAALSTSEETEKKLVQDVSACMLTVFSLVIISRNIIHATCPWLYKKEDYLVVLMLNIDFNKSKRPF